jgi:secreted trypsin-like serine protease
MRRSLLPALVCALVAATPAAAIVGGQPADEGEYPATAVLEQNGEFICGSTLIRPRWILTAAHCVLGGDSEAVDPTSLNFVIGRTRRSGEGGEELQATRVIPHEKYGEPNESSHDIALVELERDAVTAPIRIATPAERGLWAPGKQATAAGWGGKAYPGVGTTDELQEVQVPIVPDADCDQAYANGVTGDFEAETMVCAGEAGKDTCQGDSGGPLMVPDAGGAMVLTGVVSWGFGCGFPTQYGVYARVGDTVLYDWITGKVGPPPATGTPDPPPGTDPGTALPPRLRITAVKHSGKRLRVSVRGTTLRIRARLLRRGVVVARGSRSGAGQLALRLPRGASGRFRLEVRARGATGAHRSVRL